MTRRKNTKRIDPRYFLHETVLREGDDIAPEEVIQAAEELEGDPAVERAIQAALEDPEVMAAAEALNAEAGGQELPEAFDPKWGSGESVGSRGSRRAKAGHKLGNIAGATGALGVTPMAMATAIGTAALSQPASVAGTAVAAIGGAPVVAALGLGTLGLLAITYMITRRSKEMVARGEKEIAREVPPDPDSLSARAARRGARGGRPRSSDWVPE